MLQNSGHPKGEGGFVGLVAGPGLEINQCLAEKEHRTRQFEGSFELTREKKPYNCTILWLGRQQRY